MEEELDKNREKVSLSRSRTGFDPTGSGMALVWDHENEVESYCLGSPAFNRIRWRVDVT